MTSEERCGTWLPQSPSAPSSSWGTGPTLTEGLPSPSQAPWALQSPGLSPQWLCTARRASRGEQVTVGRSPGGAGAPPHLWAAGSKTAVARWHPQAPVGARVEARCLRQDPHGQPPLRWCSPGLRAVKSCGWPSRTCCLQPSLEEGGMAHYPGGQHRRPSRPSPTGRRPAGTTGKETPAPGHIYSWQLQAELPQRQAGWDDVRSVCPRTPSPSLLAQVEVVTSQDSSGRPR